MKNQMKNQKGITLIALIIIIAIVVAGIIFFISRNSTENIVLNKENFKEINEEYAEKNKNNDNVYYVVYAEMYYLIKDGFTSGLSEAFTSGTVSEDTIYKNIYGKTIKELKKEGKKLMEENNVTVEEFKKNLNDSNNNNFDAINLDEQ